MKYRAGTMNGNVETSHSYWACAIAAASVGGEACEADQVGMFSSAVPSATRARPAAVDRAAVASEASCEAAAAPTAGDEYPTSGIVWSGASRRESAYSPSS